MICRPIISLSVSQEIHISENQIKDWKHFERLFEFIRFLIYYSYLLLIRIGIAILVQYHHSLVRFDPESNFLVVLELALSDLWLSKNCFSALLCMTLT